MRVSKDTWLLVLGIAVLLILVSLSWWSWKQSGHVTTRGCREANNAIIVVYADRQALLAEKMLLSISAMWASEVPSGTRFCIMHKDDMGLHRLPLYPYIVIKGSNVAKALEPYIVGELEGTYFIDASFVAKVAFSTYHYGGRDVPSPLFNQESKLIVYNGKTPFAKIKQSQLLAQIPQLEILSGSKITKVEILDKEPPYKEARDTYYPVPVLVSNYSLDYFTRNLKRIGKGVYVYKCAGWILYDLGIVDAVEVLSEDVLKNFTLVINLSRPGNNLVRIWLLLGGKNTNCRVVSKKLDALIRIAESLGLDNIEVAVFSRKDTAYWHHLFQNISLIDDPFFVLNSLKTSCKKAPLLKQSKDVFGPSPASLGECAGNEALLGIGFKESKYMVLIRITDIDNATLKRLLEYYADKAR
ncbi:hypothetical protein PYJP_04940 [Pyrofollis japonicus]|uniref:hypothetical protein n=1 Tax=Pyrofollis japonicus TaxID=3060460 RepID=UPI00295A9D27|nr:hypothetical protein [Pyrofollis japonicus]BEP17142.1 hypothetical protein PYJP_04940 [Pyrofollis japonicus]